MSDQKALVLAKRAPDGTVEIPILGDIGSDVRADLIIRDLMMIRPKEVKFVIYSGGGSAFDSISLVGYLNSNGIISYTEIYGMCASAATLLAAHSGPKRTAMAPGSQFMIHNASGVLQKLVDDVNAFGIEFYRDAYGWDRKAIRSYMDANDGNGTFWNSDEAKKAGICSEVMNEAKVAAHWNTHAQSIAMSETKFTRTIDVPLKVALSLAASAATAFAKGEQTVSMQIEATENEASLKELADQATADRIAAEAKAKEDTDAATAMVEAAKKREEELTAQLAAKETERAAAAEQATKAAEDVVTAKAEITNKTAELVKAQEIIDKLKALPTAPAVIASMGGNVQEPAPDIKPNAGDELPEIAQMVKNHVAGANPLQKAQMEMAREAREKAQVK